jgi:hypothetical protein
MYSTDKQQGNIRVNKVVEGKRYNKGLNKRNRGASTGIAPSTQLDKLYELQKDFLVERMTPPRYEKYVQDKVTRGSYYYKTLSESDVDSLTKRYLQMTTRIQNRWNEVTDERVLKRRQLKLFRQKRQTCISDARGKLISELLCELGKIPAGKGILKNLTLSSNPDNWKLTQNSLFLGGVYIEEHDKKWTSIYRRLMSYNSSHLFDGPVCASWGLLENNDDGLSGRRPVVKDLEVRHLRSYEDKNAYVYNH